MTHHNPKKMNYEIFIFYLISSKAKKSLVVAFATARNVRENFIPDKIYVDEMCREKGPGAYTYSATSKLSFCRFRILNARINSVATL